MERVTKDPFDNYCDTIIGFVGSLVGVTFDTDQATLHKPEYKTISLVVGILICSHKLLKGPG